MKPKFPIAISLLLLLTACQRKAPESPILKLATPVESVVQPTITPQPSVTSTIIPSTPTESLPPTLTPSPTPLPLTELLFTGAIVPGRCVQAAVDVRGDADFLYDGMRSMIERADIAIGTLNAALSDYPPYTGCVRTFVLVGSPIHADAMASAGLDVMSIATNHIKNCGPIDCGNRAFFDTLANLQRVGILPVGGGENAAQALEPVVVTVNGVRFGFVSLGEIEPLTFASQTEPGIAELTEVNLRNAIQAARQVSDVVIVMPHWGSDYSETPNYRQLNFAKIAVDEGADLVMGNHAHVVQGMQYRQGVPVFFGLGSFIFDQSWSLETQQGIVVRVTFEGDHYLRHEVIPVHIEPDGYVHIPEAEEAASILERFQAISDEIP